jgi:hypothetical protein
MAFLPPLHFIKNGGIKGSESFKKVADRIGKHFHGGKI